MTSKTEVTQTVSLRVKTLLATLVFVVQYCSLLVHLAWTCVRFRFIFWMSPRRKEQMIAHMNEAAHMKDTLLEVQDWQDTLFTWKFFNQEAKMLLLDFYQKVHLHGPAANVDVITLNGEQAKLLDFSSSEERPLVVNFGSCT